VINRKNKLQKDRFMEVSEEEVPEVEDLASDEDEGEIDDREFEESRLPARTVEGLIDHGEIKDLYFSDRDQEILRADVPERLKMKQAVRL
jgi:hypothetical protein